MGTRIAPIPAGHRRPDAGTPALASEVWWLRKHSQSPCGAACERQG